MIPPRTLAAFRGPPDSGGSVGPHPSEDPRTPTPHSSTTPLAFVSQIAFVLAQRDGKTTTIRLEYLDFLARLAGVAEAFAAASVLHRGGKMPTLDPHRVRTLIDWLLNQAVNGCIADTETGQRVDHTHSW